MFLATAVLLAMEVIGSGTSPPDVKDFKPVMSKELEFRIDDCKTGFVGQVIDYQNPNNPNEFVRIYYRQVAIVSERTCENNTEEASGRDMTSSNQNYHRKQEAETLGRAQKATDAFAYVQWRVVRDTRTREDIKDGFLRSWLLEPNGNWRSSYGYDLSTSPFSEPSKINPKKRIIVGIKFTLVGGVHVVRVDQDDILAPVKAKEVANE